MQVFILSDGSFIHLTVSLRRSGSHGSTIGDLLLETLDPVSKVPLILCQVGILVEKGLVIEVCLCRLTPELTNRPAILLVHQFTVIWIHLHA